MNFGARHKSTNTFFSRMRSRRVLVLRLGVRRLGVDAKSVRSVRKRPQASASVRKRPQASASVRKRPQASASVRKRSQAFAVRPRPKIVPKRRTVVAFALAFASSRLKSVNSLRDRGGPNRETQNCRHFWTRVCYIPERTTFDSLSRCHLATYLHQYVS